MTTKVVNLLKHIGVFSIVFFNIISCEKEIESIGVNLVDNNKFTANNSLPIDVITTNENVERVISSNIPQYLLGVYSDTEFGQLEASIVSQLALPTSSDEYDYGINAAIDSVIIDIPYQYTKEDNESDGKPKFSIDSVFGKKDVEFQLNVYELKTFLNSLDPQDPTKSAVYYSDKEFTKGDTPFYSGNFKVNAADTVAYIKRYLFDGITQFDIDTIKTDNVGPSIKLPLNEEMVQQLFVENVNGIDFSNLDQFHRDFKGLYIEAKKINETTSHLVSLNMAGSKMTIYYSNNMDEGDAEDLNGNGVNGEEGVRVKHQYNFSLSSIKSNILKRDKTNSKASGADKIYVQGAAGAIATVDLFVNEDLDELRNKNLLITNATLKFYIKTDADVDASLYPEQLYLYNYDENDQVLDMLTEGLDALGGKRDFEFNEDNEKIFLNSYTFTITDYISELLKQDEPVDLVKLGLKVFNSSDLPESATQTKLKDFSWNPKEVVLYGHDASAGNKKIKLEISYTEINN